MITSRRELKEYLEADRKALGKKYDHPKFFGDEIWKFQIFLRKYEYYLNSSRGGNRLLKMYYRLRWHNAGIKLGFMVPPNVFGKGLAIVHYGLLTVNGNARIGENCRIQEGVNIGAKNNGESPVIGDNVYIGSGAKIVGGITIASNVVIGAGAVVVKSIEEEHTTWAGVPAKKL